MEKKRSESRHVRLSDFEPVSKAVLSILPAGVVRRQMVVPLAKSNGKYVVATTPEQEGHVKPEGIALLTHGSVELVFASAEDISAFIDLHYPPEGQETVLNPVLAAIPERPPQAAAKNYDRMPSALKQLLRDAMANRASQVLVQSANGKVSVRQRIRGVLITDLKSTLGQSDMTLLFDFISQSGDSHVEKDLRSVDATFETMMGSDTVQCRFVGSATGDFMMLSIHLQKKEEKAMAPSALGMGPNQLRFLEKFFARGRGLVIFCGNDTDDVEGTMRSCVRDIATPERHVMAVEINRQIWFQGVEQLVAAGDPKQFQRHLQLAFRHAPDVTVVNPVETKADAETCLSEALKGRFVLARMYAADASEAITRLLGMGIEPYMLGSALSGVVAQRTLRLVCPNCQEKEVVSRDRLKDMGIPVAMHPSSFFHGRGCDSCLRTGFDRESNIFEVLDMSDEVRGRLTKDTKAETLRTSIKAGGMMTLRQVALHKAINGQTSLSEVFRVTP
jgi:type II secretory ATPase GspE/PulE/Tfp pilus assembly ATPase PilB-like protein